MKKEVFRTLLEICVVTILLTFSIPTWQEINASTAVIDEKIEYYTERLEIYQLTKPIASILYENSDFKPANVMVYNSSSQNRKGNLLLMYSRLSTLNYNFLNISINNISYDLKELLLTTNKNYYVFDLEEVILEKFGSKEYELIFNIKEDTHIDNIYGKYFDSNVEISEY